MSAPAPARKIQQPGRAPNRRRLRYGTRMSPEDLRAVWVFYRRHRTIPLRNMLVRHYLPLARLHVGKIKKALSAKADFEELLSEGYMALIHAVERFDPGRRVKFETYCGGRIRGAMLDFLREEDWLPRDERDRVNKVSAFLQAYRDEYRREPSFEEIRDALGWTEEELQRWFSHATFPQGQMSLEYFVHMTGGQGTAETIPTGIRCTCDEMLVFDRPRTPEEANYYAIMCCPNPNCGRRFVRDTRAVEYANDRIMVETVPVPLYEK